jgi:hypothetical protein
MSGKGQGKSAWKPGDRGRPPKDAQEQMQARALRGQQRIAPGGGLAAAAPPPPPPPPRAAPAAAAPPPPAPAAARAGATGACQADADEEALLEEFGVCEHGVLLRAPCDGCRQPEAHAAAVQDTEVGEETAQRSAWRVPNHQARARWAARRDVARSG